MMEWIKLEDQIPESNIRYLVAGDDRSIFVAEWVESKWGHYFHSTDWNHCEFRHIPEITHWMPLPQPPK